jgi:hypothetical protein
LFVEQGKMIIAEIPEDNGFFVNENDTIDYFNLIKELKMVDEAYIVQAEFPSLETTENVYVLD